ncbi:MAG: T9SS type A sorting domain-containing protein [Flavobacteriales bacterium]|nr:T9SS type A sorting domain-containing protein [Flavobacteriales bacterium]
MKNSHILTWGLTGALFVCELHVVQAQAPGLEWQRCLGGVLYEESQGVVATADGGCAVLGTVASMEGDVSGNHGPPDMWLVKLSATGQIQWQRCYGGTGAEEASRLLATTDGGFLLLGKTWSSDGDITCADFAQHAWAAKVDPEGAIQWQVCLAGGQDGSEAFFYSATETGDGGYLTVGQTFADQGIWQENHGLTDFFAAKMNGTGEIEWLHCYGGSEHDKAWAVRATSDGGYVIAGTTGSSDGQVTAGSVGQVWVIKIDSDGNLLWNRRMGGSGSPGMNDDVKDLVVNPDGTILVVASTASNDGDVRGNHGGSDVWLVLLDGAGTILQQRCFGGTGNEYGWGAVRTEQGRYVVAGTTTSSDGDVSGNHSDTGRDAWVLTVDANLDLLWQKCLGGTSQDAAHALARNLAGEIFTSGQTYSTDGDVSGLHSSGVDDIWVVKLASDLTIDVSDRSALGDLLIYPSPAIDLLNVHLPDALPANTTWDIVDLMGRLVMHGPIGPATQPVQIPVEGWAGGVYCLRLYSSGFVSTTRFVKQ